MKIGTPIWHRSSGRRYVYCGSAGRGKYWIKQPGGKLRAVGVRWLSFGVRTGERV